MENKIKKMLVLAFMASSLTMTAEAYIIGNNTSDQAYVGKECSSADLKIFEEDDEKDVYGTLGFSRGDIKHLYTLKYDPKNEETIKGRVLKVLRIQFPDNDCYLVAVVTTSNGDYLENLGPVWFADENNIMIKAGDTIEVKGSKFKTNGRYIIIAAEVKKDDRSMTLRSASGATQWGAPKIQRGTSADDSVLRSRTSQY